MLWNDSVLICEATCTYMYTHRGGLCPVWVVEVKCYECTRVLLFEVTIMYIVRSTVNNIHAHATGKCKIGYKFEGHKFLHV